MSKLVPDSVVLWALEQHLLKNGGAFPEEGGEFELDALVHVKGKAKITIQDGVCNAEFPGHERKCRIVSNDIQVEVTVVQDLRPQQATYAEQEVA